MKLGYLTAYDLLKYTIKEKFNKQEQKLLNDILLDFEYCIDMTQRMEMIIEAEELKRKAFKGRVE
jgi:hypothetical protein